MLDPLFEEYVVKQLRGGFSEEQITNVLLEAGWNPEVIREAIYKIQVRKF